MVSKTYTFRKPAVKVSTGGGTTYTSSPTTVTGTEGERQQIYVDGEKRVEVTGSGGIIRTPEQTSEGIKWTATAQKQIDYLKKSGYSQQEAEQAVLSSKPNVIQAGGTIREQEARRTLQQQPQGVTPLPIPTPPPAPKTTTTGYDPYVMNPYATARGKSYPETSTTTSKLPPPSPKIKPQVSTKQPDTDLTSDKFVYNPFYLSAGISQEPSRTLEQGKKENKIIETLAMPVKPFIENIKIATSGLKAQAKTVASKSPIQLEEGSLVYKTGEYDVYKGATRSKVVEREVELINFNLAPEAAFATWTAAPKLPAVTYKLTKAGLQSIDYFGNLVRQTSVAKTIYSSGALGRWTVNLATYGAESYVTYKAGEKIVKGTAPKLEEGISKEQFNEIFGRAKSAEWRAGFQPKESSTFLGWAGRKTEAYFKGGIGTLIEPLQQERAKDVFRTTVREEAFSYGFAPEQIDSISERAEYTRKGMGVVSIIPLLQAEAFANIIGAQERQLAKEAGRMTLVRVTSKGEEIFKFTSKWAALRAKYIAGSVEGLIGTGVVIAQTFLNARLSPGIEDIELAPAYNSLEDTSFITQRMSISQEDFNKLGIVSGQPIPEGILPERTNVIYDVIGKETKDVTITPIEGGFSILTETSSPVTQVVLSQSREAQEPVFNLRAGLFPYKGKQKQFVPGKTLALLGGSVFGGLSAGGFGIVENMFTGKVGSKVVWGVGYVADVNEAFGDIATSTITSDIGRTTPSRIITMVNVPVTSFTTSEDNVQSKQKTSRATFSTARTYDVTTTTSFTNTLANVNNRAVINTKSNIISSVPVTANVPSFVNNPITNMNFNMVRSNVNVNTDVFTRIDTPVTDIINTNTKNDVFNFVNTNVNTNVNTQVNTPVFTPNWPFFPLGIDFFGGEGTARLNRPKRKQAAYTPDFISAVLNQFGKAPRQTIFTGQERRYKIRGRGFVSPIKKKKTRNIFDVFSNVLGGIKW